jgi:hypothetical protein
MRGLFRVGRGGEHGHLEGVGGGSLSCILGGHTVAL